MYDLTLKEMFLKNTSFFKIISQRRLYEASAATRRPFNWDAEIQTKASSYGISDGQNVKGTCISLRTSGFLCQYHSTNAPCSFIGRFRKIAESDY